MKQAERVGVGTRQGHVEELSCREEKTGRRQTIPSSSNKPSGWHFSRLQNKTYTGSEILSLLKQHRAARAKTEKQNIDRKR